MRRRPSTAVAWKTGMIAAAVVLAGCAGVGERYERPKVAVPAGWIGEGAASAAAWPERTWWQAFRSDELDRLVAEAQANNHDLVAAAARVAQARAKVQVAGSALSPTLAAEAAASRGKAAGGTVGNDESLRLVAAYELDFRGRNRYGLEAAEGALLASRYGQEVVRLSLTSDVAATYFHVLSLNDRLRVARDNLANARRLLAVIEVQKGAGKVSALEVEQQRTQVANAETAIPPLLQQRRITLDALAVLLGRTPEETTVSETASLRDVTPPVVPLGLPSALLERRPDIRQAEAALIAANADVGAARAALFPRLQLNAASGVQATAIGHLFSSGSGFAVLGLDVLASIFDGGRLSGAVDETQARRLELAANYRQAVLFAFRDVEDALAGIEHFAAQGTAQQEALIHAREAYRLADLRYRAGSADYLTVLDAQRTLIAAEAALDPVRFSRFSALVGLYRALGGGWEEPQVARH